MDKKIIKQINKGKYKPKTKLLNKPSKLTKKELIKKINKQLKTK